MRRRRRGRAWGKPSVPTRRYRVYRHGEYHESVNVATTGATKAAREDEVQRRIGGGAETYVVEA